MLILSRRVGEVVQVGPDIEVVVLGMKGNQVRVGIQAPAGVAVMRKEVLLRESRPQGTTLPPAAGRR